MRHLATLFRLAAPSPGSDPELLARFTRDRDEAAFAALVDRHGPMVLGVARRVLRDPDAADDVFQAVFLALARSAAAVRRPGGLPAWLHRTAVRAAVRRARARRPATLDTDPPARGADPLDALTARELLAAVDDEIGRLPAPLRAAVVACGLEGRPQDEAARLLGWTPGQVRGRLERGRRRLEARLARRGLAPAAGGVLLVARPPVVTARLRDAAVAVATGKEVAPPAVAALAAAAGRTLPVRAAAAALVLGLAVAAVAGLAPGRFNNAPEAAPIPVAQPGEVVLPEGAVRRLGTPRFRVGDGPLAVTPDGKAVVVVSPQGVVRVLDAATGAVTAEHPLPLPATAFYAGRGAVLSADGSVAVVQHWNADATGNTLTAWDLATRRPLWSLTAKNGGTSDHVDLSVDGKRLVAVLPSPDWKQAAVKLVDLGTGRERAVAEVAGPVRKVYLSPDGKRIVLVTGNDDSQAAHGLDAASGAKLWEAPAFGRVASFSPDGALLFTEVRTPGAGARLLVLDAATGRPAAGLKLPNQVFESDLAPAASPDGRTVLVGDTKKPGFVLWDYRAGVELGTVPASSYANGYPRRAAVFSRDGKVLFTSIDRLGRWDAATARPLDTTDPADGLAGPAAGVRYAADGREVQSLDMLRRFARWAADGRLLAAGTAVADWSMAPGDGPKFRSDDGAVFRAGGTTLVFDRFPGITLPISSPPPPLGEPNRFPDLPLLTVPTADGRTVLTLTDASAGGNRRRLSLMRAGPKAGQSPAAVELPWTHDLPPRPVSPCGRWIVLGGKVYATATGREVLAPEAPGLGGRPARLSTAANQFERVWFSPDGRFLAGTLAWQEGTAPGMRLVAAWELASGQAFAAVPVHAHHDAALAPGGRTLVDGGLQGLTVRDLPAGTAVRLPRRDLATGYDYRQSQPIGFHPTGRTFVTGHTDGSVIEWAVPHAARAAAAPDAAAAWAALASSDLRTARAAVEQLVDHPDAADALLKTRFTPPAAGPAAAPKDVPEGPVTGETLRGVRAIEVLERTGTPAARALLAGWRDRGASPRLAAEAAAARGRLDAVR